MVSLPRWLCAAILTLTLAGCAATAPAVQTQPAGDPTVVSTVPSRTLVMIARGEPPSLAAKPLQPVAGALDRVSPLFNALLDLVDEQGQAHPYLAEDLPRLDTDSWVVSPDGRMQTTYRLRAGLTWHDGAPLSSEDFRFAWRVYTTPELGSARTLPLSLIEEVLAPDPQTILIRWRQPYPDAGVLDRGLQPLPRHLLEDPFRQLDAPSFANHPFWTQDYVGLGPYRWSRWEPGAFLEATGFEGHALGRPKIDRVRVTIVGDANTVLATLLSGDAHFSLDVAISQEEGSVLEQEWAGRNAGTVLFNPTAARILQMQHRPEVANPRELLDVRVRRALAHALHKDELNVALQRGRAIITDSVSSPRADYAPLVGAAITRYPFDGRRAQQLLDETGLVKGADGFYATADGRPFQLDVLHLSGPANERENTLLVESFKRVGINARSVVLPVAQAGDVQNRALAPAILPPHPTEGARAFGNYSSRSIPAPDNRWLGPNYGGWSNSEFDRHWDAFNTVLDRSERLQRIVQMERVFSEQVAGIPYYYNVTVNAHVASLHGPTTRTGPEAGYSLAQVFRWEWR